MVSHLDITTRQNVRSTLKQCGLTRMPQEAKQNITSIRLFGGLEERPHQSQPWIPRRLRSSRENDENELFQILSCELPSLRYLRFRFRGAAAAGLPLRSLLVCAENMTNLVTLRLFNVRLQASTPNDLMELQEAIQSHPSLQRFTLESCCLADAISSIGPIMEGLANNPNVETIVLNDSHIVALNDNENDAVEATRAWLQYLMAHSMSMKSLKLNMMPEIQNQHIIGLAETLMTNGATHNNNKSTGLQELCIESATVHESGCLALVQWLETHPPSLERLELALYRNQDYIVDEDTMSARGDINWDKVGMARALHHNKSLKHLHIFAENITEHGFPSAFCTMLRDHNTTLEHLTVGWEEIGNRQEEREMDFYLRLNRAGRGTLTDEATKETWVNFILHHSKDLSALQYVLTRNPALVADMDASEEIWSSC